jgi:hypothetical protein
VFVRILIEVAEIESEPYCMSLDPCAVSPGGLDADGG